MKAKPAGLIAVVDTNVWISGFLTKSAKPALLIGHLLNKGQPVLSPATFTELQER